MPICESCQNQWSWRQTIKTTTTLNPKFTCPYCFGKQYQTQKSKTKVSLLSPIVLLPLLLRILFDIPGSVSIVLYPVLAVSIFLIYPFFMDISNTEQFPY